MRMMTWRALSSVSPCGARAAGGAAPGRDGGVDGRALGGHGGHVAPAAASWLRQPWQGCDRKQAFDRRRISSCSSSCSSSERAVIENNHSTDYESPPAPPSVRAFTRKVRHASISAECCFSMTFLPGMTVDGRPLSPLPSPLPPPPPVLPESALPRTPASPSGKEKHGDVADSWAIPRGTTGGGRVELSDSHTPPSLCTGLIPAPHLYGHGQLPHVANELFTLHMYLRGSHGSTG